MAGFRAGNRPEKTLNGGFEPEVRKCPAPADRNAVGGQIHYVGRAHNLSASLLSPLSSPPPRPDSSLAHDKSNHRIWSPFRGYRPLAKPGAGVLLDLGGRQSLVALTRPCFTVDHSHPRLPTGARLDVQADDDAGDRCSSGMCGHGAASRCDEYERDQLREAGDDIDSAGRRVGDASGSALDRARSGTADAARNLGNDIDDRNDQVNDAADEADGN